MRELRVSFPEPCDEKWEQMTPTGCDRICARCDKVIHDLSQLEFEEAETLLRRDPDTCVRASIGPGGVVALKSERQGSAGRMIIAAVAAGLVATQPALARRDRPDGAIAGRVESFGFSLRVIATDANGTEFRTRVNNRRFRIRHLPAGTYTLTFVPSCGESWTVENVVVGNGETVLPDVRDEGTCIIVGQARVIDRGEITINRTTESVRTHGSTRT